MTCLNTNFIDELFDNDDAEAADDDGDDDAGLPRTAGYPCRPLVNILADMLYKWMTSGCVCLRFLRTVNLISIIWGEVSVATGYIFTHGHPYDIILCCFDLIRLSKMTVITANLKTMCPLFPRNHIQVKEKCGFVYKF